MNRRPRIAGCCLPVLFVLLASAGSIVSTRHNLSSGGVGDIKSDDTSLICIFCHSSHGRTVAPLWNREDSAVVYSLYGSSTMRSTPEQPDGASKLCLSCHDGTIALGHVLSAPTDYAMRGTVNNRIPSADRSNLGADLRDDHPVSFNPAAAIAASAKLKNPDPGDKVRYDGTGKIQCTACHNPHDDTYGKFLVKSDAGGALCKSCHAIAEFAASTHNLSTATWNRSGPNPWPVSDLPTVAANACQNCHRSHAAEGRARLLGRREENVCLACHNGNVGRNIAADLAKANGHRVAFYQDIHDPAENILTAAIHVECVDCHAPHQVNSIKAQAPNVNGRLAGVSGMAISGSLIPTAQYEYEVCLKCHGQDSYIVPTGMNRLFNTGNIRLALSPGNASFHGVAAQGKGIWVPSLIAPWTLSSRLYCTDCHNSDSSTKANGLGPDGPHGSVYEYLLERRYDTGPSVPWSFNSYALCFKCHNPNALFSESLSGFPLHAKHVQGENTPCSVCHDPHGSPGYVALLNFDRTAVFPSTNGQLKFEVIGTQGYCYLNCHGENHNPLHYIRR